MRLQTGRVLRLSTLASSLCLALGATATQAASPAVDLDAVRNAELHIQTYSDYVVFDSLGDGVDLQVSIAGPDGFKLKEHHSGRGPAVVDLSDQSGKQLADGLYKYEVYAVPKVIIPREVSSAMPDRNDVREQTGPAPSPLSGSFRILNGQIMDGQEVEDGEEAQ